MKTQYFEIFGNRGVYHKGWTAVTLSTGLLGAHVGEGASLR